MLNLEGYNFGFSLGSLTQLVDTKCDKATRDTAEMTPQGWDAARITSLRTLNTSLKNYLIDEFYVSEISVAVLIKNAGITTLHNTIRSLDRMCSNGLSPEYYDLFGYNELDSKREADLIPFAKKLHHMAGLARYNPDILPEGCTAGFLTGLLADIDDVDAKIDLVRSAESSRAGATQERNLLANSIYGELVRLCAAGKDVYRNISFNPAKYNDYIIDASTTTIAETILRLTVKVEGTDENVDGALVTSEVPPMPQGYLTDEDGTVDLHYADGVLITAITIVKAGFVNLAVPDIALTEGEVTPLTVHLVAI